MKSEFLGIVSVVIAALLISWWLIGAASEPAHAAADHPYSAVMERQAKAAEKIASELELIRRELQRR